MPLHNVNYSPSCLMLCPAKPVVLLWFRLFVLFMFFGISIPVYSANKGDKPLTADETSLVLCVMPSKNTKTITNGYLSIQLNQPAVNYASFPVLSGGNNRYSVSLEGQTLRVRYFDNPTPGMYTD